MLDCYSRKILKSIREMKIFIFFIQYESIRKRKEGRCLLILDILLSSRDINVDRSVKRMKNWLTALEILSKEVEFVTSQAHKLFMTQLPIRLLGLSHVYRV